MAKIEKKTEVDVNGQPAVEAEQVSVPAGETASTYGA